MEKAMIEGICINDLESENILVIGNGFDLYHNLPTNYKDFMDVINRLIKIKKDGVRKAKWLTFLFGRDSPLYKKNNNIKKCFDTYEKQINRTELNTDNLDKMISIAEENIWFKYFDVCIKGDIGWIDFEKEIRYVIENFELFFNQAKDNPGIEEYLEGTLSIEYNKLSRNVKQVLASFEFFQDIMYHEEIPINITIKTEYTEKRNTANRIMVMGIDEMKIMNELADELDSFSRLFELYIIEIINKISVDKTMFNSIIFKEINGIISFNYTDTYKNIYDGNISYDCIEFIHGKAGDNDIVFGINSDLHDELDNFNENYIKFKKEYRRLRNGNLLNYRRLINKDKKINFIFFGHSLDKTDEDILKELIDWKDSSCTIYHYDKEAKNNYIVNLYRFYGIEKIKELMAKEKLEFRLISDYEINEEEKEYSL